MIELNDAIRQQKAEQYKMQMAKQGNTSFSQTMYVDEPAGSRMPKPFKKTYVDKLPEWVEKFKAEGLKDAEIAEIIKGKTHKYVDKWGNKSKVGALINSYDEQLTAAQMKLQPRN